MNALIVRGSKALSRPSEHPGGPLPLVREVEDFMVIIEGYDHAGLTVVTSSTGSPPIDWRWLPLSELQEELTNDQSDAIGEAMLCGGSG